MVTHFSLKKKRWMGHTASLETAQNTKHLHNIHNWDQTSTSQRLLNFKLLSKWRHPVSSSEADRLVLLSKAGICPNCGTRIPEGTAVVRGPGAFCSLDCVALFHQAEFSERARRLTAASRN